MSRMARSIHQSGTIGRRISSIKGNGNGSLRGDLFGQIIFILFVDFLVITDGVGCLVFIISARFISGFVWVVFFGVDSTILDHPSESVFHEATVATRINRITVYEILFAEGDQFTVSFGKCSFHGSGGTESPA